MKTLRIDRQYSTGLSRHNIEHGLIAAGKDLKHLQPADLDVVEDFHTLGRIATSRLAELAEINSCDEVLDAGSGIGETARWLNRLVGLDDPISVRQGDVTDLPFAQASFTVVVSQHVQMNVLDKPRMYQQARRVLVTGGRLAIWDITAGTTGERDYPLPWADQPELSHLASPDELRSLIETAGFNLVHWNDLTEQAASLMESFLSAPRAPLVLHTFIDNFAEKADNLTRGLSSGRLRVIQGVAQVTA
jgi:sarcosine/dimethylglycine N-methyltransferase